MENPIKMDDFGGKPTIFGNTCMFFFNHFLSTGHSDFSKYQWMWALYVYVFCGCCGYMQFDPILNVSSRQCAWDIYSTPSMGEVTEPTPVYSLEIRKQQINTPWELTTWNLKNVATWKKGNTPNITPGFFNPLGSILGVSKNRGKTSKFGWFIIYNGNPYLKK